MGTLVWGGNMGLFLQVINLRSLPEEGKQGEVWGPATPSQGQGPFYAFACVHPRTGGLLTNPLALAERTPLQTCAEGPRQLAQCQQEHACSGASPAAGSLHDRLEPQFPLLCSELGGTQLPRRVPVRM